MTSPRRDTREGMDEASQMLEQRIACRAYEKWQERGCPLWENEQDWFAARAEFEEELGASRQADRR